VRLKKRAPIEGNFGRSRTHVYSPVLLVIRAFVIFVLLVLLLALLVFIFLGLMGA
jgi:hypothetical protein